MTNFSDVSLFLANSPIVQHSMGLLREIESELLFSIACEKDRIFREKKKRIDRLSVAVISDNTNFGNIDNNRDFGQIKIFPSSDFDVKIPDEALLTLLDNKLILTTSNIFARIGCERFGRLYQKLPNSIFVIHDYDNHHWISNNIQAAIFSDVYVPSHQGDFLIASRVNPNIIGGIPCGSNQWSMKFILEHQAEAGSYPRSNQPLGKYYLYEQFVHRNKAISTLSQNFPDISHLNNDFHGLSQRQKWEQWCSYKLHWIIPVLNDLPIRFFDALITGGLPMIPSGLLPFVNSLNIPENFYIHYGPLDILEPNQFIEQANDLFDQEGLRGIMERQQFAINHFHVDVIVEKIIKATLRMYDVK